MKHGNSYISTHHHLGNPVSICLGRDNPKSRYRILILLHIYRMGQMGGHFTLVLLASLLVLGVFSKFFKF